MPTTPEEYFVCWAAAPEEMDARWAEGWRHFGALFFRYRSARPGGRPCTVVPLRVAVERFAPSRSQRRIIARNRDAQVGIGETVINDELEEMFERHKTRFRSDVPERLSVFLSPFMPGRVPCRNETISVRVGGRLVAASFLDVGRRATSAVYAMFDPAESRRSLGVFTMLEALRYTRETGRAHYYPGYACREPSVYDYKTNFAGLEQFDWRGRWRPLAATSGDGAT